MIGTLFCINKLQKTGLLSEITLLPHLRPSLIETIEKTHGFYDDKLSRNVCFFEFNWFRTSQGVSLIKKKFPTYHVRSYDKISMSPRHLTRGTRLPHVSLSCTVNFKETIIALRHLLTHLLNPSLLLQGVWLLRTRLEN